MPETVLLCRVDGNFGGVERTALAIAKGLNPSLYHPVVVGLANQGELLRLAREAGIETAFVPMPGRFALAGAVRELAELAAQRRAALIHTFGVRSNLLAFLLRRRIRIPWVIRLPNVNSTDYANPLAGRVMHAMNNWLIRRADGLQVISPQLEAYVRGWKRPPARIWTIPNGVDPAAIPADLDPDWFRRHHRIPPGAPVIGSVGRLEPVKGYDLLIRAMERVRAEFPGAALALVGGGGERGRLESRARSMGLPVIFTGYTPYVHNYLAGMDVFACPSRSEGVPNAAMEAMAMGLPVVSARVGGVESLIVDGRDGLLVPPGDVRALAEALTEVLRNRGLARSLGANARARIFREFTTQRMIERVQAMYGEAVCQFNAKGTAPCPKTAME